MIVERRAIPGARQKATHLNTTFSKFGSAILMISLICSLSTLGGAQKSNSTASSTLDSEARLSSLPSSESEGSTKEAAPDSLTIASPALPTNKPSSPTERRSSRGAPWHH
ncbi:hypothetical protein COLO4_38075 [Corchorus olitorius]|uniref:Uncharacterized protein n=1 Tax=Corchorus olitorius TaxID=93759 RepID=A0A1R3FXF4_9ROSI|nr:hypothetical protein COLO4_38075 [Corchorus olitorius]